MKYARVIPALALLLALAALPALGGVVCYYDSYGGPTGVTVPYANTPTEVLAALASPPAGYSSAVPAGTQVASLVVEPDAVIVDFTQAILASGLDNPRFESIFEQVRITLTQFSLPGSVRITVSGMPLYTYLPPDPNIAPGPEAQAATGQVSVSVAGLSGKKISLSPGHGQVWLGTYWGYERPITCAPLLREDDHNDEIMRYLDAFLRQDGATTKVYRCLDKDYGDYPNGNPWWKMSACYWLKNIGYPCSVYAYSSGDCNLGSGGSEVSDNVMSRPIASDYDNTDAHISLHSNALNGDCFGSSCPNGTVTYYDNSSSHATWGAISQDLAQSVQTGIVDVIRNHYSDADWRDRGALDSAGGFAETRVPDRAAILIELAFHDSCDRDALYLQDNFFRSATMWGVYKGICDYFNATPTYAFYSYEVVSENIPTIMAPGETKTVQITLRNRGVLWNETHQFRLGAVGDSDPFTTQTRYTVSGDIEATQTVTFTLNLTAPTTPGAYVTDWRMLREWVTWFGPTISKSITVAEPGSDTEPPTVPTNLSATPSGSTRINLSWTASTDNFAVAGYKVFRNGSLVGTPSTRTYQDTGLSGYTTYSYEVSAFDTFGNESAKCSPVSARTDFDISYIIDEDQAVKVSSWVDSTSTSAYNGDYIWGSSTVTNSRSVKWTPNLQVPGIYDVYAWWVASSNRSNAAPFTVSHYGGSVNVQADQTINGGKWNVLAFNAPFLAGTSGYVILNSGTGTTGAVLVADAVRFIYRGPLDLEPPSVPGNLTTTAVSSSQINLSWNASTDNVGVVGYKIYRGGSLLTTTAGTTFQNTGLTGGTAYSYQVSAYDAAGCESALSNVANATTPDVTPPSVPTGLSATAVSASQINLSWNASTDNVGVTGYKIYRGGSLLTTSTATTFQNTGLSEITAYSYQVSAYDAAGNESSKCTAVGATTLDATAPVISSVTASPSMTAAGYPVKITVAATDNLGVASVTAPGATFAAQGGGSWIGSVSAGAQLGSHDVEVVVADQAGNQSTSSVSYVTARVFGIAGSSLGLSGPTAAGGSQHVYKVWGTVVPHDNDSFDLSDGANATLRVYCPSHGLTPGQCITAIGIWNLGVVPARLDTVPTQIHIFR